MRTFCSEFQTRYETYSFGYCLYAELEHLEELAAAYDAGYLPYSGDPGEPRLLFYRARSLRVRLAELAMDKKRRYLQRQIDQLGLRLESAPAAEVLDRLGPAAFAAEARRWMEQRFDSAYLSPARLEFILTRPFCNRILSAVAPDGTVLGRVLAVDWPGGLHYWFAFYEATGVWEARSLGKWLMGAVLLRAREEGKAHAYLGTAYLPKSAYKLHGCTGGEFFDGAGWNPDAGRLAQLQQLDAAGPADRDRLKDGRILG